jgi:predicted O-methyltransferase YrrM
MTTLKFIIKKFNITYDDGTRMPIEIPQIGRNGLPVLFKELGFKTGAEIGVLEGGYSEILCQGNPEAKLYSIDPWEVRPEYTNFIKEETLEMAYEKARTRLSKYNCEIIRKLSMDAVKDFADESLDYVYIDGDHSFQASTDDIAEWTKKVKMGGIISGHDYERHRPESIIHVYEVLNGYTQAYRIRPWFILASKSIINGVITPENRTFFWIKAPLPAPKHFDI